MKYATMSLREFHRVNRGQRREDGGQMAEVK